MPFIYRHEPAKIDRTNKRGDDFIHENIVRALDHLSTLKRDNWFKILPCNFWNPTFDKVPPEFSLTTYAIKELGLSWFEVEHWLDEISRRDRYMFYLETETIVNVDERRRYYIRDICLRNIIHYRSKQP